MSHRARHRVLPLALLLVACGDGGSTGPSASVELEPPPTTVLTVGETLDLRASVTGAGDLSWTSADTAVADVEYVGATGRVEARRPGTTDVTVRVNGTDARATLTLTVDARPGGYPAASIDYYAEIGFGAEYGNSTPLVRRWGQGPRVRVNGAPTAADRATLDDVVADINALTTTVDMALVEEQPSVELHFAPQSTFPQILPNYVPGNVGFFSVWWDASQTIVQAVVLVSTEIDQEARNHIIREETTQILGLMRDSFRYPESIFQQSWTLVDRYAPIDEDLIAMLYRPELPIATAPRDAVRILRRLTRDGPVAVPPRAPAAGGSGRPGSASGGHAAR